jgi:hypothetical protein
MLELLVFKASELKDKIPSLAEVDLGRTADDALVKVALKISDAAFPLPVSRDNSSIGSLDSHRPGPGS